MLPLAGPELNKSPSATGQGISLGLSPLSDAKYTNKLHFRVSPFPRLFLIETSTPNTLHFYSTN